MTTKYTPGPWEVDQGSQHIIPSNGGGMVADAAGDSDAQRVANAHIIAAAPDMVEELQTLRKSCEEALSGEWDRSDDGFQAMIDNIDAVLQKAGL